MTAACRLDNALASLTHVGAKVELGAALLKIETVVLAAAKDGVGILLQYAVEKVAVTSALDTWGGGWVGW